MARPKKIKPQPEIPEHIGPTTETKILHAALEVFSHNGKDSTTMQQIATLAGVNKALLHYYFRTKESLYEKIFDIILKKNIIHIIDSLEEQKTFLDTLTVFVSKYMDIFSQNPSLVSFFTRDVHATGTMIKKKIKQLVAEGHISPPQAVAKALENAIKRGEVTHCDPWDLMLTIIGACLYPFMAQPIIEAFAPIGTDVFSKEFIDKRKKSIVDMVYYGLRKD